MNEKELISKAIVGDDFAIGQLYQQYRGKGIAIAKQYVNNEQDAEDMYQDAFMKVMANLDRFDTSKEFGPWLDTIIVNTCKNYLVKKKPTNFSNLSDEETEFVDTLHSNDADLMPEAVLDRKEMMNIMEGIIDTLPDAQREAVVLFYYKEMSVKQIAEVQEVPEDTVKSRLNYSRKKVSEAVLDFEKKNGIKIHGAILVPLLLALFFKNTARAAEAEAAIVSPKAVATLGKGMNAYTEMHKTPNAATAEKKGFSKAKLTTGKSAKAGVVKTAAVLMGGALITTGAIKYANSPKEDDYPEEEYVENYIDDNEQEESVQVEEAAIPEEESNVEETVQENEEIREVEETVETDYLMHPNEVKGTLFQNMDTEARLILDDYLQDRLNDDSVENTGLAYEGTMVLVNKDLNGLYDKNQVILIYSTTISVGREGNLAPTKMYFPMRFSNVIQNVDGTYSYNGCAKAWGAGSSDVDYGVVYFRFEGYSDKDRMFTDITEQRSIYDDEILFNYELDKYLSAMF